MSGRHVMHLVGWIAICSIAPVVGVELGTRGLVVGIAISIVATVWLVFWLPRAAHAAFELARYAKAMRRYRTLELLAFSNRRTRACVLSRAACHLASGRHHDADVLLAAVEPAQLDAAERVVWLNNRACAALDAGRDVHAALALVDEAVELRPDVPAVQHTRGRALIAVGRLDDAIGVLEAMRGGGELSLRLEAERCRELATAWERKGQGDYADDYRDRARLHATA